MDKYSVYYTKTLKAYYKLIDVLSSVETIPQLTAAQNMCNNWVILMKHYYEDLRKNRFSVKGWRCMKRYGLLTVTLYNELQGINEETTQSFAEEPPHEGHNKPVKIKNIYE